MAGLHNMRKTSALSIAILTLAAVLPAVGLSARAETKPAIAACSPKQYAALREPASEEKAAIEIRCSLTLDKDDVISKRLILSGERASGITIDCAGATLDTSRGTVNYGRPTVQIRSTKTRDGRWNVPTDITVRNCVVKGAIRLQGLGRNGQAEEVRLSSLKADHTKNAQQAAPKNIVLEAMTFVADGQIPLYAGPGITGLTVRNSRFQGKSDGTALYLDAESAENAILDNSFSVRTDHREQIALDGSARNRIVGNSFNNPINGGIFVYRNCGEGGTIRHQKPQHNEIAGNIFSYPKGSRDAEPAVWLNSRNGARLYCLTAPSAPFGSGLSARDFADNNTVSGNALKGGTLSLIRDDDRTNAIEGNRTE